jgi:hypothetical protein
VAVNCLDLIDYYYHREQIFRLEKCLISLFKVTQASLMTMQLFFEIDHDQFSPVLQARKD